MFGTSTKPFSLLHKVRHGRASRGVTLIEVLITIAMAGIVMGLVALGSGATSGARLKRSSTLIAGAVRVAYAHATAIGKPVRLVFDFDQRVLSMEEANTQLFAVARNEKSGGASPATEAEKAAIAEADAILKGPRAPRPSFSPTKAIGWNIEQDKPGKTLEDGIRFLAIETEHQDEAEHSARAYVYFWPGGQTERAAIQLGIVGSENDTDALTVLVSPLTGRAEIKRGRFPMPKPRDDSEESERADPGP